ncbi:MAG: OmpA family protein [Pseudomonadota bacterium]|nr:OmpA family protein [Pseudomonadota bacterium]
MKSAPIFAILGLAFAAALSAPAPLLAQDTPSKQELLDALKGKSGGPRTRALIVADPKKQGQEQALIKSLQGRTTRAITVEERTQVAEIAKDKPGVDLEIYFAYDSAAIERESLPSLTNLGQALTDGALKDSIFLVGGHTDGRGSNEYNLHLSERRADSVRAFLVHTFKIDPNRLIAVGYGEENLKNAANPEDGVNRRVQIVNLATK